MQQLSKFLISHLENNEEETITLKSDFVSSDLAEKNERASVAGKQQPNAATFQKSFQEKKTQLDLALTMK
jgi:hypothetical protein